jgi:hypothetical protein
MARIKYFKDKKIAIYIYGEKYEKHHKKHVLVLTADEDCQYGFDGEPLNCSKQLKNKEDRETVKNWILSRNAELEKAWDDINNGVNPGTID